MNLRPALAIALGCLASPALAQDWDCTKAADLPQQGMNYCAGQDFDRADRALNILWPKVRAYMKEVDSWQDADMKGAEAALLKAQRAWIDYRDGQCEAEGFQAHGGSLEPLLVYGCKAALTRRRTEELLLLMEPN